MVFRINTDGTGYQELHSFSAVAGTWGCGAMVKIVPGDGTNLGGSSGGGGTGGTGESGSGGGGDGSTLGLLLLALATTCAMRRYAHMRV